MLEKIGKYEIAEQIGVGGFGAVFRGRDPFIKRSVAIKTCSVNDEEIKSRFFREAELAGNLHHRHITTIYDFGVENGIPYIVQEFLTGEDLDKKIKRGDAIPVARKVEILMAIAEGLAYAHEAQIIHRDIKPANVRILDDGTVKIMDFGIAKSLQTESNLTQTGITLGTSAYLAPEQIRGEAVDRRTDIFALGVLAYELLALRKPFRGEHLSTVLYRILNEQPEPIESIATDVPPALAAVVRHAMEKSVDKRFSSMQDFLRDLHAVYRELTGASARYSTIARLTSTETPDSDVTVATPSHGMETLHITPPSGALARVPAPEPGHVTPPRPPAQAPGLELVNFRDSSDAAAAAQGGRATASAGAGSRKTVWAVVSVAALLLAGAAAWYLRRGEEGAKPVSEKRIASAGTPAAPADLPTPELGVDARAQEAATAPTAAPPKEPTSPPRPAPPRRFAVQFSSIPPATLYVDGRLIGPSVPAQRVELEEGAHRYRFEAPGLPTYEQTLHVTSSGSVPVAYQFPVGSLIVQADPSWIGASIIVDGKYKATVQSGAERVRLAPGAHRVIVLREGFQPANHEFVIEKGGDVNWTPAPAVPLETGG
ncbi:MAG TPA: serine/threonine-protein kinase [Thermoanaerobaculia bacterium]|nr:serine/threonine-protein kinase [Thermoanaerobaculia bacterium]